MLTVVCSLALAMGTFSQLPPAPEKQIQVTVVAILASECEGPVDPRLKAIAAEVRRLDSQLKRFTLATITTQKFVAGEKATFKLVEHATADVTIFCCGDKNDWVGIRVTPPLQGEIEYRAVCGKFLPIATRYRTAEKPSPCCLIGVLGQLSQPSLGGPFVAAARLGSGCKRDRLILAVCVQSCAGK